MCSVYCHVCILKKRMIKSRTIKYILYMYYMYICISKLKEDTAIFLQTDSFCHPPAVPSQRSVLHRLLVCAGAFLCLPIILGLARCLSSEVKPQPLPRTLSTHAAVHHPAPQPPPRCPVPQKRSAPPRKGIAWSYSVACKANLKLL